MDDPEDLCRRASRYRDIARTISDARAIEALNDLADKYEAEAAKAQARDDAGPITGLTKRF
jgi:hypothetical protein